MSDPLSVIASVVSIAGFALHSARRLKDVIDGIQGAPRAVQAVSSDLQAVSGVLDTLHRLLGQTKSRKRVSPMELELVTILQLPLHNCVSTCKEIDDAIKPHIKPTSQAKGSRWSKLAWYWREKDMLALQTKLMTSKSSLEMAIAVTTMWV